VERRWLIMMPCDPGPAAANFGRPAPQPRGPVQRAGGLVESSTRIRAWLRKARARAIFCHSPMLKFRAALELMAPQGVVAIFQGAGDAFSAGAFFGMDDVGWRWSTTLCSTRMPARWSSTWPRPSSRPPGRPPFCSMRRLWIPTCRS
jgi:hypothetical protein